MEIESEHVTVINAGAIILLQLIISAIVRKTKALPTMITGIAIGTLGMYFSVLHESMGFHSRTIYFLHWRDDCSPKFIAYIEKLHPDRKALYLGYSFMYGVIGSFVGGLLGAFYM